jgi:hypothetical protein
VIKVKRLSSTLVAANIHGSEKIEQGKFRKNGLIPLFFSWDVKSVPAGGDVFWMLSVPGGSQR